MARFEHCVVAQESLRTLRRLDDCVPLGCPPSRHLSLGHPREGAFVELFLSTPTWSSSRGQSLQGPPKDTAYGRVVGTVNPVYPLLPICLVPNLMIADLYKRKCSNFDYKSVGPSAAEKTL